MVCIAIHSEYSGKCLFLNCWRGKQTWVIYKCKRGAAEMLFTLLVFAIQSLIPSCELCVCREETENARKRRIFKHFQGVHVKLSLWMIYVVFRRIYVWEDVRLQFSIVFRLITAQLIQRYWAIRLYRVKELVYSCITLGADRIHSYGLVRLNGVGVSSKLFWVITA